MAIIEHKFTIGLKEIDKNRKISNESILGFFEDIAGFHSDKAGYGINNIDETHLSWVLLHWKLQVIDRPNYGETVTIKTWSRNPFKFYSYRDFEMYDEKGDLKAIASSKWSLIDITKGLSKLDDDIISKYESENKSVFNEIELPKLTEPSEILSTFNYTVPRQVIDINEHMHNLYYLDLAYEALPYDVYKNCTFDNVEIMYKKSAKLGDTLKCTYSKINDEHFITVKSFDEKKLHAIIKLS